MTLCYYAGDDILNSHLMFNDRWKFDRYNLKGLKTYVNDLTFGANIHLGMSYYKVKVLANVNGCMITISFLFQEDETIC